MALRRLELLIRDARLQSGNKTYTATSGVRMSEFCRYANEAQTGIHNKINNKHSSLHTRAATIDVTAGTAEYDIPDEVHNTANIVKVDYSQNGQAAGYYKLHLRSPSQEVSVQGEPEGYFLRDGKIVVTPIPSQTAEDALRINYQHTLPDLDIRRALVSAHGLTSITFTDDSTLLAETEEELAAGYVDYVCVVDKTGTQIATAIPITTYNSSTKVLSCTLTAAQNSAVTNGSHYVVFGSNSTTHSELLPICERYVTHYMALLTQMRDSNSESVVTNPFLRDLEKEILDTVEELEEDVTAVAILDDSMLDYAEGL